MPYTWTRDDLDIKYKNTLCAVLEDGVRYPFHIGGFDGDDRNVRMVGKILKDRWATLAVPMFTPSVDLSVPCGGLINLNKSAILVQRSGKRSQLKAIAPSLMVVDHISTRERAILGWKTNHRPDDANVLRALFNPKYTSARGAVDLVVSNRRLSVAFSNNYAVALKEAVNKYIFFWKNQPIGELVGGYRVGLYPYAINAKEELLARGLDVL